jgi:hypothetical protein
MPPVAKCCFCPKRIGTRENRFKISEPSILPHFKTFVGDNIVLYDESSHVLCQKCRMKIRNATTRKKVEGAWIYESMPKVKDIAARAFAEQDSPFDSQLPSTSAKSLPTNNLQNPNLDQDSDVEGNIPVCDESTNEQEFMDTEDSDGFHGIQMDELNSENIIEEPENARVSIGIQVCMNSDMGSEVVLEGNSASQSQQSVQSQASVCHLSRIQTVTATQSSCFLCKNKQGRTTVPKPAIRQVWTVLSVFVPQTNRCCRSHLNQKQEFEPEVLDLINLVKTGVEMKSSEFCDWLLTITNVKSPKHGISFDEEGIEEDYKLLTGLHKAQFDDLYNNYVCGSLRNSSNRTPRDGLGMLLMLLRGNLTQAFIGSLFRTTQPVVSSTIKAVTSTLMSTFVPRYLGVDPCNHLTRDDCQKNHNVKLFNGLFEKPFTSLGLVADATYIYIEKPQDHRKQSQSFSKHKFRNLFKFMIVCCPDGYIVEGNGPYFANGANNDATILEYMLAASDLEHFLDEGDYWIVDRGFRDLALKLRLEGVDVFMPAFKEKDQPQLTTAAANETRKVTACRFIVEQVNGRLKNVFKFLSATVEGSYSPRTIESYFKICCALLNKFFPPLFSDSSRHESIVVDVLQRAAMSNSLQEELDRMQLSTRASSRWESVNGESVQEFPRLTMQDLLKFTLGIYQIKRAAWYIKQHMSQTGDFEFFMYRQDDQLIRVKMNSRHKSGTKYNVWVKFDGTRAGLDGILGYTCDCPVGLRVVGACSHVTSVNGFFIRLLIFLFLLTVIRFRSLSIYPTIAINPSIRMPGCRRIGTV